MLKQMESETHEVGGRNYYIIPFGAFKAANLSGEIASVLAPALGALTPILMSHSGENAEETFDNINPNEVASAVASCSSIDGDAIERLLKKLLLGGNVSVEMIDDEGNSDIKRLTEDLANEVFCGNVQNMFVLAFYVIKMNYRDFFVSIPNQLGKAKSIRKTRKKV